VKPAAINASPLIILARAGYFDLLPQIFSPIMVPRAVADEILAGPVGDPVITALTGAGWLSVVDLNPGVSPIATSRLGRGETEVLEMAMRNAGTVAVLDDKAARRAATILRIPVIGTLGILVAAAQSGLVPDFATAAEAVIRAGLYADPATVEALKARLRKGREQAETGGES
jgi:predicted nucleic acid-binding protein